MGSYSQDITLEYKEKDIVNNRLMAILCYVSVLVIIPVIMARDSRYVMFNANQGIVLTAFEIVFGAIMSFLGWIPIIGLLTRLLFSVVGLVCLGLSIWGIVNVVNGKAVKLPVVGDIRVFS